MRVAFHFDASAHSGNYATGSLRAFFAALIARVPAPRRHVRIRIGDLLLQFHAPQPSGDTSALARALVTSSRRAWRTIDEDDFAQLISTTDVFVIDAVGLGLHDAQEVDEALAAGNAGYLGALEIDLRSDAHWVIYAQALADRYRVVGSELRLLHTSDELKDDPRTATRDEWKACGLFESVVFEDTGMQQSIFDPYHTREQALLDAELSDLVDRQFAAVANEALLRTRDLDARLSHVLHAAFTATEGARTREQLAQAALSCRRFLERLADCLFPATDKPREGHKLGPGQYRNRLRAYAEDHLQGTEQAVMLVTVADVAERIDALDKCAQRGVHGDQLVHAELQRLLVGLVVLAYDLLTLTPPALSPNPAALEPFTEQMISILGPLFGDSTGD